MDDEMPEYNFKQAMHDFQEYFTEYAVRGVLAVIVALALGVWGRYEKANESSNNALNEPNRAFKSRTFQKYDQKPNSNLLRNMYDFGGTKDRVHIDYFPGAKYSTIDSKLLN